MKCAKCGNEFSGRSQFCDSCISLDNVKDNNKSKKTPSKLKKILIISLPVVVLLIVLPMLYKYLYMGVFHSGTLSFGKAGNYLEEKYPDIKIGSMHSSGSLFEPMNNTFTEEDCLYSIYSINKNKSGQIETNYITHDERESLWLDIKNELKLDDNITLTTNLGTNGLVRTMSAQEYLENSRKIYIYMSEDEYTTDQFYDKSADVINELLNRNFLRKDIEGKYSKMVIIDYEAVLLPAEYMSKEVTRKYSPNDLLSVAIDAVNYDEDYYSDDFKPLPITLYDIRNRFGGIYSEKGQNNFNGITLYLFNTAKNKWIDDDNRLNGPHEMFSNFSNSIMYARVYNSSEKKNMKNLLIEITYIHQLSK